MAEFFGVIGDLVRSGLAVEERDYQGGQAESYDLMQDWTGDVDYYLRWAEKNPGPILELACGTGRVSIPLAQAGHRVWGVDISRDMLAVFRRKLSLLPEVAKNVELDCQDVCDFHFSQRFSLIIMPCFSFTHLTTAVQRTDMFNRAFKHLAPGGVLLIDTPLWVPDEDWTGSQPRYSYTRSRGKQQVTTFHQVRPDAPGLVTLNFLHVVCQGNGQARLEAVACQEYRATPAELKALASEAGFIKSAVYRDFKENPVKKGDHAGILMAKKEEG